MIKQFKSLSQFECFIKNAIAFLIKYIENPIIVGFSIQF